jgi:hypothetical protein
VPAMTATPAADRTEQSPYCPNPECNPRGTPRPLHAVPRGDATEVHCRRCHRRYDLQRDADTLIWKKRPRAGRKTTVGGKPIGPLLLGDELQEAVEKAAREDGLDRAKEIRKLILMGLAARAAKRATLR